MALSGLAGAINDIIIKGERNMAKLKDISPEDLEHMIEQKVLEVLGDPDSGLELSEEFRKKLEARLKAQPKKVPHEEVLRRFA